MVQLIFILFAFILALSDGACKTSTSERIFGGDLVDIKNFPYIVSLQRKINPLGGIHFCGGSIVSSRFILTAAHCLNNTSEEQFFIKAGTTDLKEDGIRREIEEMIFHPKWNNASLEFDFALLKLDKPLNLRNNVRVKKVILPRYSTKIPIKFGYAAGWGFTDNPSDNWNCLRKVKLEIIDKCRKVSTLRVTKAMFCAGHSERDTCKGDSGGPFVNNGVLYGVVSFGDGANCTKADIGAYAKVPYVMKWILKNIREF